MIVGFVLSGLQIIVLYRVGTRGFAFCVRGRWRNVPFVRLRLGTRRNYGKCSCCEVVIPGVSLSASSVLVDESIYSVLLTCLR